jgi:hypothetical protein
MVLGAIVCRTQNENHINNLLKGIKEKNGVTPNIELKWTKVSPSKLKMYKEAIDLILNEDLYVRVLIADKEALNHEAFEQTHDDWYYKMYYTLINYFGTIYTTDYRIFFDIKDTHSNIKTKRLSNILENKHFSTYDIKAVRSHEKQLIQLIDVLIGAAGYKYQNLKGSKAKLDLIDYIESKFSIDITSPTAFRSDKVNIFIWDGKK